MPLHSSKLLDFNENRFREKETLNFHSRKTYLVFKKNKEQDYLINLKDTLEVFGDFKISSKSV